MENKAKTTIDDFVPQFHSIDKTLAVFQDSTVLVDDTVVTVDDATAFVGGSDSIIDIGPKMKGIINL